MEEYEKNHPEEKKDDAGSSKRKAEDKPSKPAKKMDTRPKGFSRGLTAEKNYRSNQRPRRALLPHQVEGFRRGRSGAGKGGKHQDTSDCHQVLRRETQLVRG